MNSKQGNTDVRYLQSLVQITDVGIAQWWHFGCTDS